MEASYIKLLKTGELKRRVAEAYKEMRSCRLCPRSCSVNRLKNELGECRTGKLASVSSYNDHHGEEPPISGYRGSGTIFFTSCNLHCMFCQNYPISQLRHGEPKTPLEIARMMLLLQKRGCHNINLVTPSHVVPQFLASLCIAAESGLTLPIVYNSSGYDSLLALKLLDGVIDIYMPDIKYADNETAENYSKATRYWDFVRPAIKEMFRQVGDLKLDKEGIAVRGLLIRHLVLPGGGAGTERVMEFIANEVSPNTYVSLMSQYFPAYKALNHPILCKRISVKDWQDAVESLKRWGLEKGWIQPYWGQD